jgi:hypothetical protein
MTTRHLLAAVMLIGAAACGTTTSTATDDGSAGSALSAAPDPGGQCDPAAIKDLVVAAYAANAAIAAGTATTADADLAKQGRHHHFGQLVQLGFVYDADNSASLDDTEQAAIVSDFTTGCAATAAALLTKYDTSGDGTLDATELAAARAAIHPNGPDGDGPHGDGGPGGPGGHHGDGARPDGGTPGVRPDPLARLVTLYDANADGILDADEATSLRADVRARIVLGEPPFPKPVPPAATTTDTTTTGG